MKLKEFVEGAKLNGDSVVSIADRVINAPVTDDDEFVAAAKALIDAEDNFYNMMLERGLQQ